MADIELVIRIPEDVRVAITRMGLLRIPDEMQKKVDRAIQRGTLLPKGHGRLIDEQSISDYVHSHIQEINTGYGDLNNHTNRILRMIESYIDNASTIVEADKESEDKE